MAKRVLSLKSLGSVPFSAEVGRRIQLGLDPLVKEGLLEIDLLGTAKNPDYTLTFVNRSLTGALHRTGCWVHPRTAGVSGTVNPNAISERNFCRDTQKCGTCEPLFRQVPNELGKAIADTALHEIAHLFGVQEGGADGGAHVGDPGNIMFETRFHREFTPLVQDTRRTMKYRIVTGDTLSRIALRIGFVPPTGDWRTLYDFKGQDGKSNRNLLRSGNPDLIFPGEEIWIPDMMERLKWHRAMELQDRNFTPEQLRTMKDWVREGRTMMEIP
jgi:hypothetical protein